MPDGLRSRRGATFRRARSFLWPAWHFPGSVQNLPNLLSVSPHHASSDCAGDWFVLPRFRYLPYRKERNLTYVGGRTPSRGTRTLCSVLALGRNARIAPTSPRPGPGIGSRLRVRQLPAQAPAQGVGRWKGLNPRHRPRNGLECAWVLPSTLGRSKLRPKARSEARSHHRISFSRTSASATGVDAAATALGAPRCAAQLRHPGCRYANFFVASGPLATTLTFRATCFISRLLNIHRSAGSGRLESGTSARPENAQLFDRQRR